MNERRWMFLALQVFAVALSLGMAALAEADQSTQALRPPLGPLITIHAPYPEQFELALDEVELDWSKVPGAKRLAPGQSAAAISSTRIAESEALRAIAVVSGVSDQAGLLRIAGDLKTANPGAEVHLVLYETGRPRSKGSRRLLTRELGLLLEPGEDPQRILGGVSVMPVREVPGVPGGFVVETDSPMATVELAETLRRQPGVRSAYPLLKRHHFRR